MLRAAWWTYAVLALWIAGAGARVYERCELARDLRSLGVQADHVSTWVCIAFHESRFDTTANNLHSGDHGLLQISELYWCGGGKACGLSCESLRDDDISDDVKCALQVYKEHTRLQGDGFLAWVVYPQHCKHNTKKYLADCDDTLKNASTKTMEKSRALDVSRRTNLTLQLHQSIDALLPPYISMTSTSGHSRNEISFQDKNYQNKWQTQHLINIDDLSLPILGHKKHQKTESLPSSGFASQELDQSKTINNSELRNKFTTDNPAATKNRHGPCTSKILTTSSNSWHTRPPPSTTTAKPKLALTPSTVKTTTTGRPPARTTNFYHSTIMRNSKSVELLNEKPALSGKDISKKRFDCLGCRIATTQNPISTYKLTTTTEPSTSFFPRDGFKTFATSRTLSSRTNTSITSTTVHSKNKSSYDRISNLPTTTTPNTFTGHSRITTAFTTKPRTKGTQSSLTTSSFKSSITTSSFTITTPKSVTIPYTTRSSSSRHWRTITSETTSTAIEQMPDAERNAIFDLYLKPKQPKLITFRFAPQSDSVYKSRIFADGTTSPVTPWKRSGAKELRIK